MVEEKPNTKEVKFNRISNFFQIALSIIGIIWSGINRDKPGSVFLIGFLILLIITATFSLFLSESNPEKARYFAGGAIGLFLSLLLILVFGFSKIDVNPIFRPYSRKLMQDQKVGAPGKLQLKSILYQQEKQRFSQIQTQLIFLQLIQTR